MSTTVHARWACVACLLLLSLSWGLGARVATSDVPPPPPAPPPTPAPAPSPAPAPRPEPAPEVPTLPDLSTAGAPTAFSFPFEGTTGATLPAGLFPRTGRWTLADEPDAKPANRVLLQDRPTDPWAVLLCAGPGRAYADGKARARFQAVSGAEDASGGLVFRAQDGDNYYLCRANALEDNFRLYVVKRGTRWPLASVEVDPPKVGTWHVIEVEFQGDAFKATLDGKKSVEAKDATFASGWCGLWTKGDSVTRFDDWSASEAAKAPPDAKPGTAPSR